MSQNEEKQVLVVAKYLNMRKGKMVAQGAHGSMKTFFDRGTIVDQESQKFLMIPLTEEMLNWVNGRFKKVCVSVDSEDELMLVYQQAQDANLPCSLIIDSGLTEFAGVPTKTVVSIGPANPDAIDAITGHLKLL